MTVEKATIARWTCTCGSRTDDEFRDFARALVRKRLRVAFPDDFTAAAQSLQEHLIGKHNKQTDEEARLRTLRGIRVRAAPSWDDKGVQLCWWFIKDDADSVDAQVDWSTFVDKWWALRAATIRMRARRQSR